jgi:RNA polymerase sigma-70 factor, ECF subfamily
MEAQITTAAVGTVPAMQDARMTYTHEPALNRPTPSQGRRMAALDETALIARLKAGDEQALESIFHLYSSKLYNIAQRILGDAADAEEAVQDVFWTAYRKAKTFQGNSSFRPGYTA